MDIHVHDPGPLFSTSALVIRLLEQGVQGDSFLRP